MLSFLRKLILLDKARDKILALINRIGNPMLLNAIVRALKYLSS